MPPGNLDYHGQVFSQNSEIELISFSKDVISKVSDKKAENLLRLFDLENTQSWINVVGLHNVNHLKAIGKHFDIHPLVLEDILNIEHRPKTDLHANYLFFVIKMFSVSADKQDYSYEQVSMVLGKNYLITFQEKESDVFDVLKARLNDQDSNLRTNQIDYLFYRLTDTIVDGYYYTLEHIGDKIELLEESIQNNPTKDDFKSIQKLKRELIFLRKTVYPLRESVAKITKENNGLIQLENITYFNDVYDHCIHIIDSIETYRDLTSSLLDLYMTSMSNKMNEVMKVLTVISTIFIPITFIAGVYGMNFQNMPELTTKWGYPAALIFMGLLVSSMLIYFKIKKWF